MSKHKQQSRNSGKSADEFEYKIPERHEILELLASAGQPLGIRAIAASLMEEDHSDSRKALRRRLRAMERDGQIIRNRKEGYAPINKLDLLKGRIIAHPDGYGFMVPDEEGDDLFLSPRQMRKVLHGDRVIARISGIDPKGRREGHIIEVLSRANEKVVGRFYRDGGIAYLVPDNRRIHQDILITEGLSKKIKQGDILVVAITKQPDKHSQPQGSVIQLLGSEMISGMAEEIAIQTHGIPAEWPQELQPQLQKFEKGIDTEQIAGREDIRELPLVTIDGEDARDFDDAVYCEKQGQGWRLLVAIADVSSYVEPDSLLDELAYERGTSVYFPTRVIPMLPEILSNGLCSLNPEVDRLCLVCEMSIDAKGKLKRTRFFEGVMNSSARLSYTKVAAALVENDQSTREELASVLPNLEDLFSLYQVLNERRKQNGLLEFDSSEAKLQFNDEGLVESVTTLQRNDAHKLIEEFMLTANIAAAEFLLEKACPAMFRVHETPKAEKLDVTREFLSELGLSLEGGDEPDASDYATLMEQIKDRPDAHLINMVLLRSMPLAVYSADNQGHFGLSFDAYTHFTSPIRRYPDLMVHRAIRHLINYGEADEFAWTKQAMEEMAAHCSDTERRAEEASRDVIQWYKCEYMQQHIGDEFDGSISSVTAFGIFVELDELYIEGLVHVTALIPEDFYHYEQAGHRLRGERNNHVFQLGNRVRVKLVRVDMEDKKIDFELVDNRSDKTQ